MGVDITGPTDAMTETPIMLASYPRAILHLDGDAFFTSVEQAVVPALRGRPVVTGRERGIIACASYEAKALGIARGMPLFEARRKCPELVVLPSDYELYGLFSRRLFNIMRRFTPIVEEYSIDEGFADLTGLRRLFHGDYAAIARTLQETIQRELGLTVSGGLAPTKSLAKLGSKFRKPAGFTAVAGSDIHRFLPEIPLDKVWGFGPNTVSLLEKHGLRTAYDFVQRPEAWATRLLGKVGGDLWHELRGLSRYAVNPDEPAPRATIIKSKTFTPPSGDRALVYAQLIRNAEVAFERARRFALRPRLLGVVLRHQDFHPSGQEALLSRPTAVTLEALPVLADLFAQVFRDGAVYRASLVVLGRLEDDRQEQGDLFEDRARIESRRRATLAMDAVNARYGRQMVRSAATLGLADKPPVARDAPPDRRAHQRLPGETATQRLGIPRLTMTG
jgi:DNA polymerase-4/DNA polymerase V